MSEDDFAELVEDENWLKPWVETDYQVRYVFPKNDRITRLKEEMTPKGRSTERSVTAQYEGDERDDLTYLEIDISRMPVGLHTLTVIARNLRADQSTERSLVFRIVE